MSLMSKALLNKRMVKSEFLGNIKNAEYSTDLNCVNYSCILITGRLKYQHFIRKLGKNYQVILS